MPVDVPLLPRVLSKFSFRASNVVDIIEQQKGNNKQTNKKNKKGRKERNRKKTRKKRMKDRKQKKQKKKRKKHEGTLALSLAKIYFPQFNIVG